jgi:hypothetical protein
MFLHFEYFILFRPVGIAKGISASKKGKADWSGGKDQMQSAKTEKPTEGPTENLISYYKIKDCSLFRLRPHGNKS